MVVMVYSVMYSSWYSLCLWYVSGSGCTLPLSSQDQDISEKKTPALSRLPDPCLAWLELNNGPVWVEASHV